MRALDDLPVEEQIVCLAARVRPDGEAMRRLDELIAGAVDWDRLWRVGHRHEVLPLVARAIASVRADSSIAQDPARAGETGGPPSAWLADTQRRRVVTVIQNGGLLQELLAVLDDFTSASIDVIPVKGLILTQLLYGDIGLRPAGDIDVLVPSGQLSAARERLHALGFRQEARAPYEARHHPYHDAQYYRPGPNGATCLELHWGLAAPRYFSLDTAILWSRSRVAAVFDRQVRVLSPEDTLLHLAIHRSRSPLRLRWIVDIAELLRGTDDLDVHYLLDQAGAAGARTSLAMAIDLADRLLGAPAPPTLAAGLRIGRLKRSILERTCGLPALFARIPDGDVRQQPHLIYRIAEQDGIGRMAGSLAFAVFRKGDIWLDRRQA